jgi:hypothetical protein
LFAGYGKNAARYGVCRQRVFKLNYSPDAENSEFYVFILICSQMLMGTLIIRKSVVA